MSLKKRVLKVRNVLDGSVREIGLPGGATKRKLKQQKPKGGVSGGKDNG